MSGEYVDGPDGLFGPGDDVARYAAEVRAELAYLTSEQSVELLEDLEDHLREVAAEDGDLWIRLGTPKEYARELRSSAGLPPKTEAGFTWNIRPPRIGIAERVGARVAARLGHLWGTVLANPAGAATVGFVPSLRPAWWVARGWLAVVLLQFWAGGDGDHSYPIPTFGGSSVLGLLLLAGAIPASVWLGQRAPLKGKRRKLLLLTHGVAAVVAIAALSDMQAGKSLTVYSVPSGYTGPGMYDNGQPVTNLFVYDKTGKLIDGALVYSQDGQPIQVSQLGRDFYASHWLDGYGNFVPNAFPLHQAQSAFVQGPTSVQSQISAIPWTTPQLPEGIWEQQLPSTSGHPQGPTAASQPSAPGAQPSAPDAQPSAPGAP